MFIILWSLFSFENVCSFSPYFIFKARVSLRHSLQGRERGRGFQKREQKVADRAESWATASSRHRVVEPSCCLCHNVMKGLSYDISATPTAANLYGRGEMLEFWFGDSAFKNSQPTKKTVQPGNAVIASLKRVLSYNFTINTNNQRRLSQ